MTKRNPKQEGTNLWDCVPQTGPCPMNCHQCFYNRLGAFYVPIDKPHIPSPKEVGNGIVRMNCGHDSNIQREKVIETAQKYKNYFFNTSIPNLDFPGPVVFTANPKEEDSYIRPVEIPLDNLMFIRLRVSPTNLDIIEEAVSDWTTQNIPVVLTLMAYYDQLPPGAEKGKEFNPVVYHRNLIDTPTHEWKQRHINSYWCPTVEYKKYIVRRMKAIGNTMVTLCGTYNSNWCRDCHNCESYYWQTKKHLEEIQ